jgi:DNA-binding HxlR family transcriptional regulator
METVENTALTFEAEWVAIYGRGCPSRSIVELLANKWTLYVLGALSRAPRAVRFNELRRLLDGVSQKVLTQTLRRLERDGLVHRSVYPTVPPRVEYSLTQLGRSAAALTTAIGDWSVAHVPMIDQAREAFDVRAARDPAPVD